MRAAPVAYRCLDGAVDAGRWVLVVESDEAGRRSPVGCAVTVGQSVTVGREGQLPVGLAVPDVAISRVGVTVTATADGWLLDVSNRNGAMLHPWGEPPLPVRGRLAVSWPLLGLRLHGEKHLEHWVLLEAPEVAAREDGPTGRTSSGVTRRNEPPLPLTGPQQEALRCMFAHMLCWPPVAAGESRQLKQVARQLGNQITEEGVQQRLRKARSKAAALGLSRQLNLSDPEYLYVLVRAGYVRPEVALLQHRADLVVAPLAEAGDADDVPV